MLRVAAPARLAGAVLAGAVLGLLAVLAGAPAGPLAGAPVEAAFSARTANGPVTAQAGAWRSYRATLDGDVPVGWWRLGDAAGSTTALARRGADGTYSGAPTLQATGVIAGDPDGAVTFDGVDDRVSLGDVHDFTGTSPFSVELWFRRGPLGTESPRLIAKVRVESGVSDGWTLGINGSTNAFAGTLFFGRYGGGQATFSGSPVIAEGVWYHVVCTYDGSTQRLYLDGVLRSTDASTLSLLDTAQVATIGSLGTFNHFRGTVDEVSVYDRALPAHSVRAHYYAGRAGVAP